MNTKTRLLSTCQFCILWIVLSIALYSCENDQKSKTEEIQDDISEVMKKAEDLEDLMDSTKKIDDFDQKYHNSDSAVGKYVLKRTQVEK